MSYETRYAAMKRQQEDARSNTPEAIADRRARQQASEQAQKDRREKFPELTMSNAEAAIKFQDERYDFHYRDLTEEQE